MIGDGDAQSRLQRNRDRDHQRYHRVTKTKRRRITQAPTSNNEDLQTGSRLQIETEPCEYNHVPVDEQSHNLSEYQAAPSSEGDIDATSGSDRAANSSRLEGGNAKTAVECSTRKEITVKEVPRACDEALRKTLNHSLAPLTPVKLKVDEDEIGARECRLTSTPPMCPSADAETKSCVDGHPTGGSEEQATADAGNVGGTQILQISSNAPTLEESQIGEAEREEVNNINARLIQIETRRRELNWEAARLRKRRKTIEQASPRNSE